MLLLCPNPPWRHCLQGGQPLRFSRIMFAVSCKNCWATIASVRDTNIMLVLSVEWRQRVADTTTPPPCATTLTFWRAWILAFQMMPLPLSCTSSSLLNSGTKLIKAKPPICCVVEDCPKHFGRCNVCESSSSTIVHPPYCGYFMATTRRVFPTAESLAEADLEVDPEMMLDMDFIYLDAEKGDIEPAKIM